MVHDEAVSELKRVLYVDRVYSALQELGRRQYDRTIDLRTSELRIFSQNGEDGVLDALIGALGTAPRFFVEFGVGDGWSCNCRALAEIREWSGVFIEPDVESYSLLEERYRNSHRISCLRAFVTPLNVNEVFRLNGVPGEFGVLAIDTDGQDYWIWSALSSEFRPRIVVAEFNAEHGPDERIVELEGTSPQAHLSRSWGASAAALVELASGKGYELVHIEMASVNMFFVDQNFLNPSLRARIQGRLLPPSPNYGLRGQGLPATTAYPDGAKGERPTVHLDT